MYAAPSGSSQSQQLQLSSRVLGPFYYHQKIFVSDIILEEDCKINFCRNTPFQGHLIILEKKSLVRYRQTYETIWVAYVAGISFRLEK